jgi:hypothetical protein
VLREVAEHVPDPFHKNVIIVGSLAAAYHFFGHEKDREVRTKDVDCLLTPHAEAAHSGEAVAAEMIRRGWRHRTEGEFTRPQPFPEPRAELSAVRLHPPHSQDWFAELLSVPASEDDHGQDWIPIRLESGYFGLPTFEFMPLAAYRALPSEFGIRYARPEMMALANLLSHPAIGEDSMSAPVDDRAIKRSNKDLGRVLSLAWLSGDQAVETWPVLWEAAIRTCYPTRWPELAESCGSGFRALLDSDEDFEEAHHTCVYGLLVREPPTLGRLRAIGLRVLQDAIEPIEALVP